MARFCLSPLLGDTVNTKILEVFLQKLLEESENLIWLNISELAKHAKISKSSSKRVVEELLSQDFVEEKHVETHAQNPPRYFRLNSSNSVVVELLFFYRKVRAFM